MGRRGGLFRIEPTEHEAKSSITSPSSISIAARDERDVDNLIGSFIIIIATASGEGNIRCPRSPRKGTRAKASGGKALSCNDTHS